MESNYKGQCAKGQMFHIFLTEKKRKMKEYTCKLLRKTIKIYGMLTRKLEIIN